MPKKWRDQFQTKNFLAVETKEGLLIKPITEIEYYEDEGGFGLRFPKGIEAGKLARMMKVANKKIALAERAKGVRTRKKKHG